MGRRETGCSWVLVLAALGAAPLARADGDGFKIGESGRLHVFGEVDAGYDSNALYTAGGSPAGSAVLDFIPGLKLAVPGRLVELSLDGQLDYKLYLAQQASLANLSHLFGGASLGLDVNKNGVVGLQVKDSFSSSASSTSLSISQTAVSNYNVLDVAVPYRPGGGALTFTASGQWMLDTFGSYGPVLNGCDGTPLCNYNGDISSYNYNQLSAALQGKWFFLPRTAAVLEGSYFNRLPSDTSVSLPVQGVRADGGLVGLVTSHLSATLKGGWGGLVGTPQVSLSTWLATVELDYQTLGSLDARVGWVHDFSADVGIDYAVYEYDRVYVDFHWLLSRFTLKLSGSWQYVDYIQQGVTGPIWQVNPGVDYGLARWCTVGAAYIFTNRSSNATDVPAFNFTRNQVFGYVRATF